jgi:hypothetical protein
MHILDVGANIHGLTPPFFFESYQGKILRVGAHEIEPYVVLAYGFLQTMMN